MHAALNVPICQPGEHWIREGRCGVLARWLLAAIGVTFLGAALVAWGGGVRWRESRRAITPAE